MSVSGHKIYAPKGVGVLFIKRKKPRIHINPILHGGGHEYGYRSGTLSVHNIVGFGKACEIANVNYKSDNKHLKKLSTMLLAGLKKNFPKAVIGLSLWVDMEAGGFFVMKRA